MDWLIISYTLVAGPALILAALLLLQAYESTRYFWSRLRKPVPRSFTPRAELIIPCKGVDLGFDVMVEAALRQDYPAYGVTFVVESADDPAHGRIRALCDRFPGVPTRLVVAGTAQDCGQKVQNLLAATNDLDPAVQILAFMDSDIQPPLDWLRRMVIRLRHSKVGAVTGYRWLMPKEPNGPALLLTSLNAGIAGMLGNGGWNVLWGGSWAIRRETFEAAGIREAWKGTLSDDLAAWQALRRARKRVAFEPGCLVPSPVRCTWRSVAEFARRQYLITRVYAPRLWWTALLGGLLFTTTFWGGLICGAARWLAGQGAGPFFVPPLLLYAIGAVRAGLRQSTAAVRLAEWRESLRAPAWFDILAHPIITLANVGFLLSAAVGREITWRGIRYRLVSARETQILARPAPVVLQSPADRRSEAA